MILNKRSKIQSRVENFHFRGSLRKFSANVSKRVMLSKSKNAEGASYVKFSKKKSFTDNS